MLPDFKTLRTTEHARLGEAGALAMLEAGRKWNLAPVLSSGGAVVFPHICIDACGPHTAAAVHACLDSGARRVVALGVLHAINDDLKQARSRVADGGDATREPCRGIQGPGLPGRQDWQTEFSLLHFHFLWQIELRRRGIAGPELVLRYPFLAAGRPESMPGIAELQDLASDGESRRRHAQTSLSCHPERSEGSSNPALGSRGQGSGGQRGAGPGKILHCAQNDEGRAPQQEHALRGAVIVATADEFHHGIGYGDAPDKALAPDSGGLDLARRRIGDGLALLESGDYPGFENHCASARSDARDVGQVLRHLIGPCKARVLDVAWEDTSAAYQSPSPTWVAGALATLIPAVSV